MVIWSRAARRGDGDPVVAQPTSSEQTSMHGAMRSIESSFARTLCRARGVRARDPCGITRDAGAVWAGASVAAESRVVLEVAVEVAPPGRTPRRPAWTSRPAGHGNAL